MENFGEVKTNLPGTIKMTSTYAPDRRSLSLIFENARIKDYADEGNKHASLSFDIKVSLNRGSNARYCSVGVRAGSIHNMPDAFGVLRLQVNGFRKKIAEVENSGSLYDTLEVPLAQTNSINISVLMLTNAGMNSNAESLLEIDSLDLQLRD